jgi:EAL domain-containing protein (putative c-di-GMP-specific phosphodiesterase class I)
MLGPDDFFAVAEETGLAHPISAWIREEACAQTVRWREEHPEWGQFAMGVNLTAAELHQSELARSVSRVIEASGVDPSAIMFEISERFIADATDVANTQLLRLRELGVLLALDDFGTGSGALIHLKRMPVDTVKIDRAFVGGLGIDPVDDAIVEAILDLSHKLDLCTIAEGVETAGQEQRLLDMGCHFAQGFRFAPALPADEIEPHLGRRGGRIAIPSLRS